MTSSTRLDAIPFLALLAVLSAACSNPADYPTRNVRRPAGLAITCLDTAGEPMPLADCSSSSARAFAWILDADLAAVSIVDLTYGSRLDADLFVPGYTPLHLGGDLVDIAADPGSRAVFVLGRARSELIRVDSADLGIVRQALPCVPWSMDTAEAGPAAGSLVVACTAPPGLAMVPIEGVGTLDPAAIRFLPLHGHPAYVALSGDGTRAYVTHVPSGDERKPGWLSLVDVESGEESFARLFPACSDGLDDDGDGLVDHDDPGCLAPGDPHEEPDEPGTCMNGKDDDGDGWTDTDDPDCRGPDGVEFHVVPWPACMNGKDDDGDGWTDTDDPDCYGDLWPDESSIPTPAVGRPAVSPDGSWVLVPLGGNNPGLAVFDTDPFERVDPNVSDPVLHRLGIDLIHLPVQPFEVVTASLASGVRAFTTLASGQVTRIVVGDTEGAQAHHVDWSDQEVQPSATPPVLRVNGEVVSKAVDLHPEFPSLGPLTVDLVPGTDDRYSFYGITFAEDAGRVLSETWRMTFEGRIPGARGILGFVLGDGENGVLEFVDPASDMCASGVQAGDEGFEADHLVIEPAPGPCMRDGAEGAYNACEYAITAVHRRGVELSSIDGMAGLDTLAQLPGPLSWTIRASDSWVAVGSRSGFLHNMAASGDECVTREDADPMFTGRLRTSPPFPGETPSSCPVKGDDPAMDWAYFTNPSFTLRVFPACELDDRLEVRLLPGIRDTEISFVVSGGLTPVLVSPGGILVSPTVLGGLLYVVDSYSGALHVIDMESMALVRSFY